ncbi:nitroreductase family protein [Sporosarcina sp. P21c]|uniref:nitroreductase family protein n=1 Tax=unclassified Sporosarcina TaxID=2647733 RepID=UPI000C165F11|nr:MULTISPECIES: nitroreductase family protein [unclassified Sporosarcina]PIC66696.1 nitroreductase family protein [Sporosarcina sp. P16a]PIC83450.1 nitroreductase family protein [Sporosarcina sp. P1]PIC89831.1 nitroreductase family protein [Sporosarcina sp. P21c]PIC93217.1 nitroreductase family protein [Sporosarcina sp. P25]
MSQNYEELLEVMHARKSVRKFDPNYTIDKNDITSMLEEAISAPSSSNLQPWRFLVIQDQELKKKINRFSFNQEQIETASAIIAVIGDTEMYHNIDEIYLSNLAAGNIDEENVQIQIQNAKAAYPNAPLEVRRNIATFDAGLVSMQLMLIAKARGFDTVPMGGFDKQQFAESFELESRYEPLVLIALGKAASPAYGSTRLPIDAITTYL